MHPGGEEWCVLAGVCVGVSRWEDRKVLPFSLPAPPLALTSPLLRLFFFFLNPLFYISLTEKHNKNKKTTFNNGSLGSRNDEERSELR